MQSLGVEKAYEEFLKTDKTKMKFYCVGYSVVRYYLNHYAIGNLEGHKAGSIGVDVIATFLPDDVVDGLYKAVGLAGLEVANLTLEPIAAIQVAIPEAYRMLNIALVDVGAGTSDISITKDGSIVAYGMIPIAGDALTEVIAKHCLVDFKSAEKIKREAGEKEEIEYKDILGLKQTISREKILEVTAPVIQDMTRQVADKIKELNGDRSVSAVFVVGGGGTLKGYTDALADKLEIQRERVAVRGEEVMQQIAFYEEDARKDSLMVTPIGICLSFYEQSNNFIFVYFNGQRVKLYDNNKLAVVDAVIMVNGNEADIYTPIHANDRIEVTESTAGEPAALDINQLPEYGAVMAVEVNEKRVELPKFAMVNGQLQSGYYGIHENDVIEFQGYYTVRQVAEFMDVIINEELNIYVNNKLADMDTKVYENFSVIWTMEELQLSDRDIYGTGRPDTYENLPEDDGTYVKSEPKPEEITQTAQAGAQNMTDTVPVAEGASASFANASIAVSNEVTAGAASGAESEPASAMAGAAPGTEAQNISGGAADSTEGVQEQAGQMSNIPLAIHVTVNGEQIRLEGKAAYIFVDVFDHINFDLSVPQGSGIATELNGRNAQYMEPIHSGDVIKIYWKD